MKRILQLILVVLVHCSFVAYAFAGELIFEVLDVGQADAILIRTAEKTVLVDAGERNSGVTTLLANRGVQRLDLLVGTHPHADHIGGMLGVLESFPVAVYMDNGMPHTTAAYNNLMAFAESQVMAGKMKYIVARQGQRLNLGDEAYFDVLLPAEKPIQGTRSDINANSIILRLVHGDVCFLLTGDAEAETEQALVDLVGHCQILKASHHGSRHSSIDVFLDAVKPKESIVTCGLANKHGHPGAEFLERMQARNINVHRTDLQGSIRVVSNGKTYRVEPEHAPIEVSKININLASKNALMDLPGIGQKTAQAVIDYREANGPFLKIEDIVKASPKQARRLEKTFPFITIEGGSATGLTTDKPLSAMPNMPALAAGQGQAGDSAGRININTAGVQQLTGFPGIGAKKAEDIIKYRDANGPFQNCQSITNVKGIGAKTYEKFADLCTTQ